MTTSPETLLVGALWGTYLLACIHWVAPGQVAMVRASPGVWEPRTIQPASYTLLGRMPVLSNPLRTRANVVLFEQAKLVSIPHHVWLEAEQKTEELSFVCSLQAVFLLVVVPWITLKGLLEFLWGPLLILLVGLHLAVLAEFWTATFNGQKRSGYPAALTAIAINPVGACRAAEVVVARCLPLSPAEA